MNRSTRVLNSLMLSAVLASPVARGAQSSPPATPQAAAGARLLGTVLSTDAGAVTLKLETGAQAVITVTPDTKLVRTAPGAKTLAGATVIKLGDLEPGDRVLVRTLPGADATHYSASAVIVMKQADIAQAQQQSEQDWQHRGVAGVVKTIDTSSPGAGGSSGPTIMLGTAQPGKLLTVHVTPKTILRRYSPDSIRFADAKMTTIDQIQPGDQVRARGDRSGDELTAEEVVAGTFRNIAGTVIAVDAATNKVTVTDLATKKPVTLTLNADTQARKLPPETAQRIAARFKPAGQRSGSTTGPAGSPAAASPGASGRPGGPASAGMDEAAGQQPRGDLATLLQRAPAVTLAELKKGDAVMIVATQCTPSTATAITLLAGVEPLLESSSGASQGVFSASWNLGGSPGGGEAGAAQ